MSKEPPSMHTMAYYGPTSVPPTYEQAMSQPSAPPPEICSNQQPYVSQHTVQAPVGQPVPVPPQQPVYIVQQPPVPNVRVNISVGPNPCKINCPHCQKMITTRIRTEAQKSAHIAALVICLFCCWPCFWIPYCMSSFQDVHHTCPNCKGFIGTYKH